MSGSPLDWRRPAPAVLTSWSPSGIAVNHARPTRGSFSPQLLSPPGCFSTASFAGSEMRRSPSRSAAGPSALRFGASPSATSLRSLRSASSAELFSVGGDSPFPASPRPKFLPATPRPKSLRAPFFAAEVGSPSSTQLAVTTARPRGAAKRLDDCWLLRGYASWETPRNALHGRALQRSNTDW